MERRRATLSLVLFLALLAMSWHSLLVSSQTSSDSCSNSLSLGSLVPFNTTGLNCFQAWSSQDFILRFGKAASVNNLWSFVLSAPDNGGYISMGFSPTGRMVGSSAVAGWVTAAGVGSARQYYLGGTSSRSCPPDQGKLALAKGAAPTIVSKGSRLYLAFQFAGQPLTDVIYAVGPSGSLPGSNGLLSQHQDMASGTISLSGGGSGGGSPATGGGDGDGDGDGDGGEGNGKSKRSGGSSDGGDDGNGERRTSPSSASSSGASGGGAGLSAKRRHGVLAVISWGVMIPAGVALARFFKRFDPFWFYAHVAAQALGFVLGALAVVAGFRLDDGPVATHKVIGIVILVCACLQVMALLARPAKETKARRYWNWYHHNVGRAAIVLGVANIFYGLALAKGGQEWSYVYGIFVGISAVVYLVLETRGVETQGTERAADRGLFRLQLATFLSLFLLSFFAVFRSPVCD